MHKSNVSTAVIVAAGLGSRLKGVLDDRPKGFLEIDGVTLIKRTADMLHDFGIEKIIIVTGYKSHYYDAFAKENDRVYTIHNPFFDNSSSMHSLYCAKELINETFLLIESDLIFERQALNIMTRSYFDNAILLSGSTCSGDEVFVETKNGLISHLSKDRHLLENITGELVGISKISLDMFKKMCSYAEEYFHCNDFYLDYEQCITSISPTVPVQPIKIEKLLWAEIDAADHYQRVISSIYPQIMEKQNNETFSYA
jgi:choline kinase